MIPGYVREVGPGDEWAARYAPAAFRVVIVDELARQTGTPSWMRLDRPDMRCRFVSNRTVCGQPAVLAIDRARGRRRAVYGYCPDHLYGRRWDPATGQLLASILVEADATPNERTHP